MKKIMLAGISAAFIFAGCTLPGGGASEAGVKYIDEFDFSAMTCGMGRKAQPRLSFDGHPLRLGERTYERGFGTHAESAIGFSLNGKAIAFDATVGIDRDAADVKGRTSRKASAVFRVWTDGKIAWDSGVVEENSKPRDCHVELLGVTELVLETTTTAPWIGFESSNADWADACIHYEAGAVIKTIQPGEQLGILTPPEAKEPRINGASVWGVRPGHPVIFRVATSGVRPMTFKAEGLPEGVTFNSSLGILGGVAPKEPGEYPITVTAENKEGTATRVITLKVGDTIALTPPMGWNSWNIWGWQLTAEHVKASVRAMEASGLGNHGWAYINLDDWWEMNNSGNDRAKKRPEVVGPARDAKGRIIPNPSFPNMKELTDYIHSFGYKAGLYSSPGPRTCGDCEGSYGHEMEDATSYAEWGFDYLKYDWCSYGEIFKKETGWGTWDSPSSATKERPYPGTDAWAKPYRLMSKCLRAQNRDIVHAFCQYGRGRTQDWGREAGGQVWRCWQDMKDSWTWMWKAIEGYMPNCDYYRYTGPGFWADPDMMIVGLQRSFGSTHPTYLTPNEQYTHVSLWALLASPLLMGCDLTKLDPFTKNLLVNDEVIAINQDTLGHQARPLVRDQAYEIWARPLADGGWAAGLVNRYPLTREVRFDFEKLGIEGKWKVRDCWRQKDLGEAEDSFAAEIPPHATLLIRLSR